MKKTYISLFSSAGIGCYAFKLEGFDCIATNELIERRLNIQKSNDKCKYESGYISGDIAKDETKELLYSEISMWRKKHGISNVDVVIATPPCQGMSVANHKKTDNEIVRNSLVVESIRIIKEIKPTYFIFENVPAFMKTICTDIDRLDKPISEAINNNLGDDYIYASKIINFKNYGASSSRSRSLVIGVLKEKNDVISPIELFPDLVKEKTLREVIGGMKPLTKMGYIDESDIYHNFRSYPDYMRAWIHNLGEGKSAFDNEDDLLKPHQIINGKIVINKRKNANKYTRQYWDKVGPCVHTRNDQLASQNTIHPKDDRVFSIREIMKMMTVPESFKWSDYDIDELNSLPDNEKKKYLKREEIKIRQTLGEAVPTAIFQSIAKKIKKSIEEENLTSKELLTIIENYNLSKLENLKRFIESNPLNVNFTSLSKIAEISNTKRTENAAFYTSKTLITEMMKELNPTDKAEIHILEPSVGIGNFIPFIKEKFGDKRIFLDLMDIDNDALEIAKILLSKISIPDNITLNFINADFLNYDFNKVYDYVIGNPPFGRLSSKNVKLKEYLNNAKNKNTTNISSFFLDKILTLSENVFLVFPKFLLNTPEFNVTRHFLSKIKVKTIIDFGEKGFPGVLIETIGIQILPKKRPSFTKIISLTNKIVINQKQNYIMDNNLPYWIIYRNDFFDLIFNKMNFGIFEVYRDRQITKSHLTHNSNDNLRVLKARNITDDGKITNIPGYDSYVDKKIAHNFGVYKYFNRDDVYLTPNMTYKPRVIKNPMGVLVNGSVAVLIPKNKITLSENQLLYFSSDEYRTFYQLARNYQTRSLNVDPYSVFFFGILKED
jgi:DNA (cytosine-5)-methyltransferase 1